MKFWKRLGALTLALALSLSLAACGGQKEETGLEKITFVLDWTPNTNHTGLYVAQAKGYFEEAGLDVEIVQPPEDGAELLVASGRAQFGVSFQDYVGAALSGDTALDITAVAAILQHNTCGIVSRAGEGMSRPKGLEGHRYATWNREVEQATLRQVVETDGGDFSKVELIPSTATDELSALQSDSVDALWIFYGWAGIACELAGLETDFFAFRDIDPVFDLYTPVVIGNDHFLEEEPETARAFLAALSRGYQDAIADPQAAAEILMEASPELKDSAELVLASQKYLAEQYQADADRWGEFDPERWAGFFTWLNDNALVPNLLEPAEGFTNDFLPAA